MGISTNSHGKKYDKETQSPLLKIFKEIMTRENDDPEKRNLLMEQKEDKKRRQYSGSRTKTDRRSCESSSSEHRKRGNTYKSSSIEQRAELKQTRSQSIPYQNEKKESWWFWQKDQKKPTEDTCSCVSCALKRIVSSEYACIGCLLLLFTLSIVVAFLVVFKSVPTLSPDSSPEKEKICPPKGKAPDSERLKRKIEMLNENRLKNDLAGLEEYHRKDKRGYDDALSGHVAGIPGSSGIDFGPSFRELNSLDESESKMLDQDWASVLDADKTVNEMQSSDKLREFYKKLVQTDAKIKSLKKTNHGTGYLANEDPVLKTPDRSKRSLKLYNYPKRYHVVRRRRSSIGKNHKVSHGNIIKRRQINTTRLKRFGNDSEEPTGFVIEKKKLIVQYKPTGMKQRLPVKKCSHAPKDSHTHEKQLNHPFYKNTQRLDELLDKFLNKNLPEIMSDPFGLDMLFNHDNKNTKCKHPPNKNVDIIGKEQTLIDQIPKPKIKYKKINEETKLDTNTVSPEILKMLRPESTTQYEKDFYHHEVQMIGKEKQKIVTASPNEFEVLLSVSTIMNPDLKKTGNLPVVSLLSKVPNLRRLLQSEENDDENLGYEDFKEVLTDDMANHDESEKSVDRKKRNDQEQPLPQEKIPKYNPPGVHNPNWKGPMPLYPDELNSMIRHAAMNANKVEFPINTNDLQSDIITRKARDLSDVEYVEDYLSNKYDKLVEMAQAYSDYGVLDGKKESRNEKNPSDVTATDHRIKLSADEDFFKAGLLGRLKKVEGKFPSTKMATSDSNRRQRDITTTEHEDFTEQTGGIPNTFFYTPPHTEGIRFEIRPTTKSRDDDIEVLKVLQKHVKIEPNFSNNYNSSLVKTSTASSTLISSYPDMEFVYSPKKEQNNANHEAGKNLFKTNDDIEKENALIFALSKGKRTLLSTDYKSTEVRTDVETTEDWEEHYEKSENNAIDKFLQSLSHRKFKNETKDKVLSRYIELIKQKNIKIYSSAPPDVSNYTTTPKFEESISTIPNYNALFLKNDNGISRFNETIVTINKSEIKMDEYSGNRFEGTMLLTVENPEIGVEHIDLTFDVPLVVNFNDELLMMNDSMISRNNFSDFDLSTTYYSDQNDANDTDIMMDNIPDFDDNYGNKTFRNRLKREHPSENLLENPSAANVTEIPISLPENVISSNSSINFNVNVSNMNKSDGDMPLSDFFMMISNWFKTLEGVKVDKSRDNTGSDLTELLLSFKNSSETANSTDTAYPLYDSDMIENIGHRSRVLLSIENLNLANTTNEKKEMRQTNVTRVKRAEDAAGNAKTTSKVTASPTKSKSTTPVFSKKFNITKELKKMAKLKTTTQGKTNKIKTKHRKYKAKFKRNADESNLIFWNDIYDDEYGIQNDKFDHSVAEKHSAKNNDFIKRSGRWVHDKFKKFAENLKINPHAQDLEIKERVLRSVQTPGISKYPKYIYEKLTDRIGRRDSDDKEEEEYDPEQKSIFTALSANMKDVCKKAARAVQQTRNIEVREDSKQGSIAASLMQQLVRLLTDLVDYQVQQKTCTKLPQDLENFLEWLTFPKEQAQEPQQEGLTFKTPFQEEDLIEELELPIGTEEKPTDHSQDYVTQPTNEKPGLVNDVRVHYLECLHSVQDLLEQFDDMSDDEKSKMTGVKNYLENQVRFLNKQISGYDIFTLFEKHNNQVRYKRDLRRAKKMHQLKRRPKRKLNKYVKNFGKKHTRTTASYNDAVRATEMERKVADNNYGRVKLTKDQTIDARLTNDVKRNLKDVYYKAIAEAKKYATAKGVQKNDEITKFATTAAQVHTSSL